ncbi:MAG: hypothetical protein LAO20_10365 [Acidobacteriia bacterium]|nr:hypothetical protein [Terriglobia bacterium]
MSHELANSRNAQLWPSQLSALHSLFHLYAPRFLNLGPDSAARNERLAWASGIVGHELDSFSSLLPDEAARLIDLMKKALGQEITPARRRLPDRDQAHAYGTAGRRANPSNEIRLVDAPTLELLGDLRLQLGWTPERFAGFLNSTSSPVRGGAIRTLGEANSVIWALRNMLRRAARAANPNEKGTHTQKKGLKRRSAIHGGTGFLF